MAGSSIDQSETPSTPSAQAARMHVGRAWHLTGRKLKVASERLEKGYLTDKSRGLHRRAGLSERAVLVQAPARLCDSLVGAFQDWVSIVTGRYRDVNNKPPVKTAIPNQLFPPRQSSQSCASGIQHRIRADTWSDIFTLGRPAPQSSDGDHHHRHSTANATRPPPR